jgi:hypothetical protein
MLNRLIKILIIIAIILYFSKPAIENFFLKRKGICSKAVLTNNKVGIRYHKSTLVYEFNINSLKYTGNSNIDDWSKVGDSICIVYLYDLPSINAPKSYFKGLINITVNESS